MVANVWTLTLPFSSAEVGGAVGDHLPMRGRGDRDVVAGLHVGLVEAGEHPLGVGGFELRVQIDLAVDGIDEAMQALAGVGETAVRLDHQRVLLGQAPQRNAGGLVVAGDVDGVPVEHRAVHGVGGQVEVGVRAGQRLELDGGGRPERRLRGGQVRTIV